MSYAEKLKILVEMDGSAARAEAERTGKGIQGSLERSEASGAKLGATMTKAGLGMAATGAVIVGAMTKAGSSAETAALGIGKVQRLAGGTAEQASALAYAFQQTGVDVDQLGNSFGFLAKAMEAGKLEEYGIASRDANGQLREMPAVLADIADKMQGTANAAERDAMAKALLGKAGMALIPTLQQGSDGLKRWAEEAKETGNILDQSAIAKARELKDAQRDLSASVQGLANSFGQTAIPVMTGFSRAAEHAVQGITGLNTSTHGAVAGLAAASGGALVAGGAFLTMAGAVMKVKNSMGGLSDGAKFGGSIAAGLAVGLAYATALEGKLSAIASEVKGAAQVDANRAMAAGYRATYDQVQQNLSQVHALDEAIANSHAPWDETQRKAWIEQRNAMAESTNQMAALINRSEELHNSQGLSADAAFKQAQAEAAKKKAIDDGVSSIGEELSATEASTRANQAHVRSIDDVISAMQREFDKAHASVDAQFAYADAVQKAFDTWKTNGTTMDWIHNTMDLTTAKGRENFKAFEEVAISGEKVAEGLLQIDPSGQLATKSLNDMTAALRRQMTQQGYSQHAIDVFLETMKLTAKDWELRLTTAGFDEATSKANALIKLLTDSGLSAEVAKAYADYYATNPRSVRPMATGGYSTGGEHLVGERGPEIVRLPGGSYVQSADGNGGGGGGTQTVQVTSVIQIDSREIARAVTNHEVARSGIAR